MRKRYFAPLVFILLPFLVEAEEQKPRVVLKPFEVEGLGEEEAHLIESLIESYIADFSGTVIRQEQLPENSFEDAEAFPEQPDFILSGSVYLEHDSRILLLEINNPESGETVRYISTHKTSGDLALKTRSIVQRIFSQGAEEEDAPGEEAEPLTESRITGTWNGDKGIETIRLQRGGTGIAILSSGITMSLHYTIENDVLRVRQVSPNNERFYHPVPYQVAKQMAETAEPMEWEFMLYKQGSLLKGIKKSSAVRYEGDTILEIIHNSIREAEWTKISR